MASSALLVLAAYGSAMQAAPSTSQAETAWPILIREDLLRLARVEWQLRQSAKDQCPTSSAGAGIVVDYIGAYEDWAQRDVQESLSLGELPQIVGVLAGTPAASAGIEAGDEIVALDGHTSKDLLFRSPDPALLADEIQDRISSYPSGQTITFSLRRNGQPLTRKVRLTSLCGARFFLKTDDAIAAHSDGHNIEATTGIVRFTENDDELALIMGHELAHVISENGEPAGFFGSRKLEDRADTLGAALAHCAGYNVVRSLAFWIRFDKHDRLSTAGNSTHRSPSEREKRLRNEADSLRCPANP